MLFSYGTDRRLAASFLAVAVLVQSLHPAESYWCGKQLKRMVDIICKGCINGPSKRDKKGPESIFKRHGDHLRAKRNIVEECCYNACSVDHIKTYYCSTACWEK